MLGVGWTEMLLIGVVALIVIGPKELPAVMNRIGKFAGTIRRMGQDFQRELNKTTGLNEIANLRNSVTQPLKATADAIRKEFNTTTPTGEVQPSGALKPADPKVESVVDEIKAAAGMAPAAAAVSAGKPAAESIKAAVAAKVAANSATPAKAPVKAARPVKLKAPAADQPVTTAEIPPARKPAPKGASKAPKAKQPAEPAPAAPVAAAATPVKAAAKPKVARSKPAAVPETPELAPKARPSRAKKPAVPKKS